MMLDSQRCYSSFLQTWHWVFGKTIPGIGKSDFRRTENQIGFPESSSRKPSAMFAGTSCNNHSLTHKGIGIVDSFGSTTNLATLTHGYTHPYTPAPPHSHRGLLNFVPKLSSNKRDSLSIESTRQRALRHPGRRPARALDDRSPPHRRPWGPSGKGVPSATAEARTFL